MCKAGKDDRCKTMKPRLAVRKLSKNKTKKRRKKGRNITKKEDERE
jgi:hypothetical protein